MKSFSHLKAAGGGFTIVELMIIVIIVGVLVLTGVPLYRQQVLNSSLLEGEALARLLAVNERMFYAEHRSYYAPAPYGSGVYISSDTVLNVRAAQNKIFREFKIEGDATSWKGTITGSTRGRALTVTVSQTGTADPVIDSRTGNVE